MAVAAWAVDTAIEQEPMMFAKSLVGMAALGVVGLWYLRARSPSGMRLQTRRATHLTTDDVLPDAPNAAERLTHSHALGVAGGVEMPLTHDAGAAPADAEQAGDAAWPATREFLRGA
jgi:hypothetical protein